MDDIRQVDADSFPHCTSEVTTLESFNSWAMRSLYLAGELVIGAVALIFYTKDNVKHGGGFGDGFGDDDDDHHHHRYHCRYQKHRSKWLCQANKHPTVAKSSNQGILIYDQGSW